MQIQDHPAVIWAGAVITFVSVLAGVGGVFWYFEDERRRNIEWFDQDVKHDAIVEAALEKIQENQADLRIQLTINNRLLREVRSAQHTIVGNQVEGNYRLGKLIGKHDTFEESVERLEELVK